MRRSSKRHFREPGRKIDGGSNVVDGNKVVGTSPHGGGRSLGEFSNAGARSSAREKAQEANVVTNQADADNPTVILAPSATDPVGRTASNLFEARDVFINATAITNSIASGANLNFIANESETSPELYGLIGDAVSNTPSSLLSGQLPTEPSDVTVG
jgi:hypothetical protein